MESERSSPPAAPLPDAESPSGPAAVAVVDGVRIELLGTAHVSKVSADEVRARIEQGGYDLVAIELDARRHAAITNPDALLKTDLFTVLRSGQAGAMAAQLALGAFQQRLADQMGIQPGQEFREAIDAAKRADVPLALVDRDIGVTLARVYRNVPWWRRSELLVGLAASVLSRERIDEQEIERLKEGDVLEATFAEFAERSQFLYQPLIAERDRYMAARLRQEAAKLARRRERDGSEAQKAILVIVGAGHLKGIREALAEPTPAKAADTLRTLSQRPPKSRLAQAAPWLLVAAILALIVTGFVRNAEVGLAALQDWMWINAVGGAAGAAAAAAHPLTIVVTALATPFTSLNPMIGAGYVAAAIELWRRKPRMGDFQNLRADTTSVRGWYRNRVSRTLLVFLGATLGSALATWLAGARIVTRLF